MEQSIKNLEAVLNLCISRGAFKTLSEANQSACILEQFKQDVAKLFGDFKVVEKDKESAETRNAKLIIERNQLSLDVDELEDKLERTHRELTEKIVAVKKLEAILYKKPSSIPKQSELKPIAGKNK